MSEAQRVAQFITPEVAEGFQAMTRPSEPPPPVSAAPPTTPAEPPQDTQAAPETPTPLPSPSGDMTYIVSIENRPSTARRLITDANGNSVFEAPKGTFARGDRVNLVDQGFCIRRQGYLNVLNALTLHPDVEKQLQEVIRSKQQEYAYEATGPADLIPQQCEPFALPTTDAKTR